MLPGFGGLDWPLSIPAIAAKNIASAVDWLGFIFSFVIFFLLKQFYCALVQSGAHTSSRLP
jgi:hypothetical protein